MKQKPVSVVEELKTRILIKIISSRGHDEFEDFPNAAYERVLDQCTNHSKWCYIDGIQTNPRALTIDMLINAADITLTNALVGG